MPGFIARIPVSFLAVFVLACLMCCAPVTAFARSSTDTYDIAAELLPNGTLMVISTLSHSITQPENYLEEQIPVTPAAFSATAAVFASKSNVPASSSSASSSAVSTSYSNSASSHSPDSLASGVSSSQIPDGVSVLNQAVSSDVRLTVDKVSVKSANDLTPRDLAQVDFDNKLVEKFNYSKEALDEAWMFDPETKTVYVMGFFETNINVTFEYHLENVLVFGADVAYLPWCYAAGAGTGAPNDTQMKLKLPQGAVITDDQGSAFSEREAAGQASKAAPDTAAPAQPEAAAPEAAGQPSEAAPDAAAPAHPSEAAPDAAAPAQPEAAAPTQPSEGAQEAAGQPSEAAPAQPDAAAPDAPGVSTPAQADARLCQAFVYAEAVNAITVQKKPPARTGVSMADTYFFEGSIVSNTKLAFAKSAYGKRPFAKTLAINIVMDRTLFDADASGTANATLTYADIAAANRRVTSDIVSNRTTDYRTSQTAQTRPNTYSSSRPNNSSSSSLFSMARDGLAWLIVVFCVGGFAVVVVLTAAEFLHSYRPDPRAKTLVHSTSEIPDARMHPLVFDDLFHHEFEPEPQDLETEILRLAAMGAIKVTRTDVFEGFEVQKVEQPQVATMNAVDMQALGLLFPHGEPQHTTLAGIRERMGENPAQTKALFENWKKKIVEEADESGCAEQRISKLSVAAALACSIYLIGTAAIAYLFEIFVALLAMGAAFLLNNVRKRLKKRIVLTEKGSNLKARGDGLCNWLKEAPPEKIADTDDARVLADRLTYISVFGRDSWANDKVLGIVETDPDNEIMRNIEAAYCRKPDGCTWSMSFAARVVSAVENACAQVQAKPVK